MCMRNREQTGSTLQKSSDAGFTSIAKLHVMGRAGEEGEQEKHSALQKSANKTWSANVIHLASDFLL